MQFTIKENGKNGSIEVSETGLTRKDKKLIGRDNTTFINYSRINSVTHVSKMIGADNVEVVVGGDVYVWKCADASKLATLINDKL